MTVQELSLESLYSKGYFSQKIEVPKSLYEKIQSLPFTDTNEKYGNDSAPLLNTSPGCESFWEEILPQYERPFVEKFKAFDSRVYAAHRYRKGDGLNWHRDHDPLYPLNHILYLGEENWLRDFGGYLLVGEGRGSDDVIYPDHGTLITLLNWSPFFWHKVDTLKLELKRYSLLAKSGYLSWRS